MLDTTTFPPERILYTPQETAERLRISARTVYDMIRLKKIGSVKVAGTPGKAGGRVFVSEADIVAFLQANHSGPNPA